MANNEMSKRFKKEILEIYVAGKNIDDILTMTIDDALLFEQLEMEDLPTSMYEKRVVELKKYCDDNAKLNQKMSNIKPDCPYNRDFKRNYLKEVHGNPIMQKMKNLVVISRSDEANQRIRNPQIRSSPSKNP